jgi:uncharacterized surface protein with fasciclin (FAS1) repeats
MRACYLPARLGLPFACAVALLLCAACGDERATPGASPLGEPSLLQKDTTVDASLAQVLRRWERFRMFSTMLDSAGLLATLRRGGPYTVFAATDPGIDKMPEGLVAELLLPANRERLRQVVAYHIHRGRLSKDTLRRPNAISTLTGQSLLVSVEDGRVLIGGTRVSEYVITASNGRLFAFDALAMPPVGGATAELPEAEPNDSLDNNDSLDTYDTVGADDGQGTGGSNGNNGSNGDGAETGGNEGAGEGRGSGSTGSGGSSSGNTGSDGSSPPALRF